MFFAPPRSGSPAFAPPDVSRLMAQVSRDSLILEAQLADESNRNGWTSPETAAPVRPVAPARARRLVPVKFAPVAGPVSLSRTLPACAMHEAAHAVVARAQGLGVYRVRTSALGGACDLEPAALELPGRCAVAAAAGPVLDSLLGTPSSLNAHDYGHVARFRADVLRLTGRAMPGDPFDIARGWLTFAPSVAAVNRVAAALATTGVLYAPTLDAIISGAP